MKNSYVYIDETGAFEQTVNTQNPLIVGGFHTDKSPKEMEQEYMTFLEKLGMSKDSPEIHMTEIRGQNQTLCEQINVEAVKLLKRLDARLVYAYWIDDPEPEIPILQDVLGTNRFYHMMRSLLRSIIVFPSIALLKLETSTIIPTIAQRSVPTREIDGSAVGRFFIGSDNMITILSQDHQEHLFRGMNNVRVPSVKKVDDIVITRPVPKKDQYFSRRIGLMLADIVCHLLREFHSGNKIEGVQELISIPIPYSSQWKEVEHELGIAHQSKSVFGQFCDTINNDDASFLIQARKNHLQYLLQCCDVDNQNLHDLRSYALSIVEAEQKSKSGMYPKSTFILGHLPFKKELQELRLRLTQSNHAGNAVESALGNLNPEEMLHEIHDTLTKDLQSFIQHGEDYALLGVSYQDNFLFDEAISVIEDKFLPVATPIVEQSTIPWSIYGRCISNLAQSLAMRGEAEDLIKAKQYLLQSKTFYTDGIDLSQWSCHTASFAALVGDEALFAEAIKNLFHSDDVGEILTGISRGDLQPFSLATLLRGAIHKTKSTGAAIRAWFSNEEQWRSIRDLLIPIKNDHPTERITRYLGELAPVHIFENLETELAPIGSPPIFSPNSTIQCVSNIATYAAWACKASSVKQEELFQYWANRAYQELQLLENQYMSASILDIYSESGLMYPIWQALNEESMDRFSPLSLQALLGCFRNEWR